MAIDFDELQQATEQLFANIAIQEADEAMIRLYIVRYYYLIYHRLRQCLTHKLGMT